MERVIIDQWRGYRLIALPPELEIPPDVTCLYLVPDADRSGFHA